jgi:protein tyrosine/serine phosphatase
MPFDRLKDSLDRLEERFRLGWGRDISTPAGRVAAWWHFQLADHAFLRALWRNEHEIAPGVWRANQPSPRRIAEYARRGFRTILNLRGMNGHSHDLFEREACARHGLALEEQRLSTGALVEAGRLLDLLDAFDRVEKPVLIHCKSGADRTGLAAAMYLIAVEGRPVAEAMRQLHWRYLHFRSRKTGILDHMLESFAADHAATGIGLRDWIATAYDPERLTAEWRGPGHAPGRHGRGRGRGRRRGGGRRA